MRWRMRRPRSASAFFAHLSNVPPLKLERNPSAQFHQLYFTHTLWRRRERPTDGLATPYRLTRTSRESKAGPETAQPASRRERDL